MFKRVTAKWFLAGLALISLAACGSQGEVSNQQNESSVGGGEEEVVSNPIQVTNALSSPSEMQKGDILYIDLSESGSKTISFEGVEAGAEFNLVVGNAAFSGDREALQLSADSNFLPDVVKEEMDQIEKEDPLDLQESFDASMRVRELDLALSEEMPLSPNFSLGKAVITSEIIESGVQEFRVLSSLSSSKSYKTISAFAECIQDSVVFYVDEEVSTSNLSSSDVDSLCDQFNETVKKEQELFGSISDVNGDGRVTVLMTPQVNRLGALGGGIITGFFSAADLYERSASNPVSNNQEILYVMVPDPNGDYG